MTTSHLLPFTFSSSGSSKALNVSEDQTVIQKNKWSAMIAAFNATACAPDNGFQCVEGSKDLEALHLPQRPHSLLGERRGFADRETPAHFRKYQYAKSQTQPPSLWRGKLRHHHLAIDRIRWPVSSSSSHYG